MNSHAAVDLISNVLAAFGFRAEVFSSPQVCGPWRINTTGMHRATFHLVSRGACWLHLRDRPPQALRSGDLVVFPNDAWHVLTAEPELEGDDTRVFEDVDGPMTALVCGMFEFTYGYDNPILEALPECILIRAGAGGTRLGTIVDLLSDEATLDQPGRQAVLDKLSDALFIMVLRQHLVEAQPQTGWLAAAAAPDIGPALAAMHREPHRPWQLVDLAQRARLSRTAFSARFASLLGESPIAYLTAWRMKLAERMLINERASVDDIAERLGYDTTSAFRRAFRRVTGRTPGEVRRGSNHQE
jgi:AraC-like DNA-binding protein